MRPAFPRRTVVAAAAAALLSTLACAEAPTTPPEAATTGAAAIFAAAPTTSNKADLVVQSVGHTPASPSDADLVTFSATVANVGQNKAPHAFDVQFDFGNGVTEVVTVPALAGGASVSVSSTPRTIAAGSYTATVTADYGDRINEGNETNNAATHAYVVTNHVITFEVDASGNPICPAGCDLTTEFASRGVVFSYESTVTTQTNASICDGSRIDPPALVASGNHEVTGPSGYPCGGTATGVLVMSFSGSPTSVQMVLRAPETCTATPLTVTPAGTTGTTSITYTTTNRYQYNGTTEYALERTAVVTNSGGISQIRVSIDGCAEYVDDLVITQ